MYFLHVLGSFKVKLKSVSSRKLFLIFPLSQTVIQFCLLCFPFCVERPCQSREHKGIAIYQAGDLYCKLIYHMQLSEPFHDFFCGIPLMTLMATTEAFCTMGSVKASNYEMPNMMNLFTRRRNSQC